MLEVPSGIWADAVSRRLLLALAPLLSGAGYALWVLAPSYEAFALGFVLWGAQGALQSGALEALVYEELERDGAEDRYPRLMGRATALGTIAAGVATGLAAPVFAAGGFEAVGAASVLACAVAAAVGASLPEHRRARRRPARRRRAPATEERAGLRAFAAIVGDGARELRRSRALRGAVLLVPAVVTVWGSLDEYLPLLATEAGAAARDVPLLALLVYAGMAAGGVLADRVRRLRGRGIATVLAAAAALLAAGALAGTPAGFALDRPRLRRLPGGHRRRRRPAPGRDRGPCPLHGHLARRPAHRGGHDRHVRGLRRGLGGREPRAAVRRVRGRLPARRAVRRPRRRPGQLTRSRSQSTTASRISGSASSTMPCPRTVVVTTSERTAPSIMSSALATSRSSAMKSTSCGR